MNVNGAVSAQNASITAGTLNIGNLAGSGGIHASNSLSAVVSGDATITGGYLSTNNGDIELLIGHDLLLGNASYAGSIYAGVGQPVGQPPPHYYPDVSIAVGGSIRLTHGASITAANDAYLDLLGPGSTLEMSGGSYILTDRGTGVIGTAYVDFATRTSGGIMIDGAETTTTTVGGSGFYALNTSTPATEGAGLDVHWYKPGGGDNSVAQQLVDAINKAAENASTTETPTDETDPKVGKKDKDDKDGDQFGEEGEGKKDEKPAQRKVAQCT